MVMLVSRNSFRHRQVARMDHRASIARRSWCGTRTYLQIGARASAGLVDTILKGLRLLVAAVAALILFAMPVAAQEPPRDVETAWRLLDYIAVDYPQAVKDGRVASPTEYSEQQEFAATVATKVAELPPRPERAQLASQLAQLRAAIDRRAPGPQVADQAHKLAAALLRIYPVTVAPTAPPSFARGQSLYRENCASCHGVSGDGRGPDAANLSVPPIAFTDAGRARERSVFALYQVVTQGLDGTPMRSFDELPSEDRWALAFYASQFSFSDRDAAEGERLWKTDPALRELIPDLKTLAALTPQSLASEIGQRKADALMAYLRRNPDAIGRAIPASLNLVRERMAASLAASERGDVARARELALSAYLDGFEPIEPTLSARNPGLMTRIEAAMIGYRSAVGRESASALADRGRAIDSLLDEAEAALAPGSESAASTFLGAATILLREGLEALLIVVAMVAFLRKAERTDAVRYVHSGWVAALAAGFLTWVVATWAIGISGASRELTEGFGSIFAAAVLLSVGIWMHGKAQANQWQRYIRERMAKALSGRSAWFLFGLAFVVVYREVFETILFYAALSAQGNGPAMLAGAATAVVLLALIAWAMLRFSRELPIGKFFTYSSWLMAVLTVILAGKGVGALQEAGLIGVIPLTDVPRFKMLGLFPSVQTVIAQATMALALAMGFGWNRWRAAVEEG